MNIKAGKQSHLKDKHLANVSMHWSATNHSSLKKPFRPPGAPSLRYKKLKTTQSPSKHEDRKASPAKPSVILWASPSQPKIKVIVPDILGKFLRPHQVEGVEFMFNCVSGLGKFNGSGCILADDMGLGKTLQSITLLYTLLCTGFNMKPTIQKAIVVCPTSLVKNWQDEIFKWLRGKIRTVTLSESGKYAVSSGIEKFTSGPHSPEVLIISYETFRLYSDNLTQNSSYCELLICDEAHRLKNAKSKLNKALSKLPCRKRVLLSGTPMQNDLEEFYAMVDFANPYILGNQRDFKRDFMTPILEGREPNATTIEKEFAQKCTTDLYASVSPFILRRTNSINATHLPPKLTQIVCIKLTPLQNSIYAYFLRELCISEDNENTKTTSDVLSSITLLKKLCNHPSLILEKWKSLQQSIRSSTKEFRSEIQQIFGYCMDNTSQKESNSLWSGKMIVLDDMMQTMRKTSSDRIVIVSNYTQTLDLIAVLCSERSLPYVRLDGTISSSKRKKLVDQFNNKKTDIFAFLLSSKAGGCGLNLIGANRLILFDPDWNPATDKQAAARIWREGQTKKCYIYRFISTGTLEEKIFQRQLSKEGLQSIVDDKEEVNSLCSKNLKKLFILLNDTLSDTHDLLKCTRCQWEKKSVNYFQPQIELPADEDLNNWAHHCSYHTVDDNLLKEVGQKRQNKQISFIFGCRVDKELLQAVTAKDNSEIHTCTEAPIMEMIGKDNSLINSVEIQSKEDEEIKPPIVNIIEDDESEFIDFDLDSDSDFEKELSEI